MTISFTKVKLPYGWLGNMAPYPIVAHGVEWRTSEALFQAERFTDVDIRETIRAATSPMAAKMIAKQHRDRMTIVPRSTDDLKLMARVLMMKVKQHPELAEQLLATGDEDIVEDCSARPNDSGLFWGAAKQPDGTWLGQNQLGKLWMVVRAHVRQSRSPV